MPEIILNLNETSDIMLLPYPYNHIEELYNADLEILQCLFNEGRCHIYATVLKKHHENYQLYAIYRENDLQHVYCIEPENGYIIDSTGFYMSIEDYMNADGINRFLLVEHRPITMKEINDYIDKGILIHSSLNSMELAEKTMLLLKQI